jgi:hypothetical protein
MRTGTHDVLLAWKLSAIKYADFNFYKGNLVTSLLLVYEGFASFFFFFPNKLLFIKKRKLGQEVLELL